MALKHLLKRLTLPAQGARQRHGRRGLSSGRPCHCRAFHVADGKKCWLDQVSLSRSGIMGCSSEGFRQRLLVCNMQHHRLQKHNSCAQTLHPRERASKGLACDWQQGQPTSSHFPGSQQQQGFQRFPQRSRLVCSAVLFDWMRKFAEHGFPIKRVVGPLTRRKCQQSTSASPQRVSWA